MAPGLYDVYHLKAEVWSKSQVADVPVHFPADYELVAHVKALSLEEVYEKTNSLDGPWWERADVQCVKHSRSTSIDDIVVDPAGDLHVLGRDGWIQCRFPVTQTLETKPTIEVS